MIRKGQITMESLLLYGLAILVVLLAIGALTFFGVLDLGRALPDRCTLTGSGALECREWSVTKAPSQVTLGLVNSGTTLVKVTSATFTAEASGVTCTYTNVAGLDIPAGADAPVTMTCTPAFNQDVGQKVRGELELVYSGEIVPTNKASGSLVATLTS